MRSLGAGNTFMNVDKHFIDDIAPNDYIMLCTDGILENIDDAELMDILGNRQEVMDKQRLFLAYCHGNTLDNFSMYLVQIEAVG